MMSKYIMFKKPRYCCNASSIGYSRPYVSIGDLIRYRSVCTDGSYLYSFGRVLGALSNGVKTDGCGEVYGEETLAVLSTDEMMSHGFERHVALADVCEVRSVANPEPDASFTRWFLFGSVGSPELMYKIAVYGALSNGYVGKYLTAPEGLVRPDWHEIAMGRSKPAEPSTMSDDEIVTTFTEMVIGDTDSDTLEAFVVAQSEKVQVLLRAALQLKEAFDKKIID